MIWWYGGFLLAVYGGVSLVVSHVDASWRRLFHPWIIVGGMNMIYTLTPLTSPVIRQEQLPMLEAFLLVQLTGLIGLGIGTVGAYAITGTPRSAEPLQFPGIDNVGLLRAALLVFLVLWLLAFQVSEGGIVRVIQEGYLYDSNPSAGSVLVYAAVTYPLIALIIIGYFVRGPKWDIAITAALFAILNVLAGHRNFMLLEVGSILFAYTLRRRRPSYPVLAAGGILGFAFLMFIGIYRGLGAQGFPLLISILKQDGLRVFDPSTQELGTSFNVFRIFRETQGAGFENWFPGESYVRAFLSTVPRQLWPDRPSSIATYFSDMHAVPGEGVGFSFNLEAYVGLGTPGVMLATMVLGFSLTQIFIRHCSRRMTLFGFGFYNSLIFISFNLNRIDLQTVLKIGALLIGSQYIVLRMFDKRRRRPAPLREVSLARAESLSL